MHTTVLQGGKTFLALLAVEQIATEQGQQLSEKMLFGGNGRSSLQCREHLKKTEELLLNQKPQQPEWVESKKKLKWFDLMEAICGYRRANK